MTGMDDLVTWLARQLDEDERVAQAATCGGPTPWRIEGMAIVGRSWQASGASPETLVVKHTWPQEAGHIVRWDPARVLAEVDAKRRILDRYADALARQGDWEESQIAAHICAEEYEGWLIPALALPYANRPGYLQEWRPDGS